MLQAGTTIGRYVVKRKLAEGGMAEIYLAAAVGAEGFSKEVVLKVVKEFLTVDRQFLDMFLAEAKLGSKLSHANIVQIFDFGKHEDTFYLAMEYVRGASLWDLRKRCRELGEPFPPVLAAEVGAQVARGMQHAHTLKERGVPLGIVHRDVTPHNVLLGFDGAVKLTDFGIAKASTTQTVPGVLKGKFAYMSPEQGLGEKVDARTDVFALGIVLWELVTGGRLFDADTDLGVLRAVQEAAIVPPSRLNAEVGQDLSDIIIKALTRPLAERTQTAFELERALATYVLRTARSPEETSVSSYLQRLFAREYEAEGRPGTPIGTSAVKRPAPADDFGSGKTLHVDRGHELTTPSDASRSRTDESPRVGPLEDAPAERTHEMPEHAGRDHTAQMHGQRPSGRLPPLNTDVTVRRDDERPRTAQMPGVKASGRLPRVDDAPRTDPVPPPVAAAAGQRGPVPERAQAVAPPITEPHAAQPRSRILLYAVAGVTVVAAVVAAASTALERAPAASNALGQPLAAGAIEARLAVAPSDAGALAEAAVPVRDAGPAPVAALEPLPGEGVPPPTVLVEERRTPTPAAQLRGTLALKAVPFATVSVHGQTFEVEGSKAIALPPGEYAVTFTHPRATRTEKVTIRAGQTSRLSFDALTR